jgi:cellulose synthase/poly-beta-1,6-N-acetylglucosamine synthase-like glycosyltransferase
MLITFLNFIYLILASGYALWILKLIHGLGCLKTSSNVWQPRVSVIIPARNEAENIAQCIQSVMNQTYPSELFEAIVVDDCSDDNTADIVDELTTIHPNLKLLRLDPQDSPNISPKKYAIRTGIAHSTGEIVLTTDADCIVPSIWISTMIGQFDDETGAVCGWVRLNENLTRFARFQALEAFALVTAGAGSIGLGKPLIANGANLAYRRSIFDEVGGFNGIDHLASGDDDLLIQKIHRETKLKVDFAPQPDSIVKARPAATLREFLNQRCRWASKGIHYKQPPVVICLGLVYAYFLLLLLGLPFCFVFGFSGVVFGLSLLIKIFPDYFLTTRGLELIGKRVRFYDFILVEIGQILYVLLVGPLALFRGFEWKSRQYSK